MWQWLLSRVAVTTRRRVTRFLLWSPQILFALRRRWAYDVSAGGAFAALRIAPPDHVGSPTCGADFPEPCGQGGDHELAKDAATAQFALGWDWIQATPDRNTGERASTSERERESERERARVSESERPRATSSDHERARASK